MKYLVVEIQTANDGTVSSLATAYDDQSKAESAYYGVLSAAAISSLQMHSAAILRNDGVLMMSRGFDRTGDVGE